MSEPITSDELSPAIACGVAAARAGDARESCLYPPGPKRDAWLAAFDAAVVYHEPLHKVLPNGQPLHRVPFGWSPS